MFCDHIQRMILASILSAALSASAAGRRQIDFQSSLQKQNQPLFLMSVMVEPTLPSPGLAAEPDYTRGSQNTVYWESAGILATVKALGYELFVFEVEAQIDTSLLWGFVDVGVDSATFRYLPEGIRIFYRLRYYAESPGGGYEMSHWSEPVYSVQDWSPPVLHAWIIQDLQQSGGTDWVVGQVLWSRVIASDSLYGGVMEIAIHEKSRFADNITLIDFDNTPVFLDTLVLYPIRTPANEPMTLTLWAVDVAGQASESMSKELFWWPDEEGEPQMICYPNPFRPAAGEKSVIKVNRPGVQKGRVFDPFGNVIAVLAKPSNTLFFEWDGKNQEGKEVARGGYIFVIDGQQDLYCKIAIY